MAGCLKRVLVLAYREHVCDSGHHFDSVLFIFIFIYFWLRWVFIAVHRLSLVVHRLNSCGAQALLLQGIWNLP